MITRSKKEYKQAEKAKSTEGHVVSNKKLSADTYQLTIECPEIALIAKPGQFISILCGHVLLRRPFSIAGVDGFDLKIIYKLKGKGTDYLSKLESGSVVDIVGSLGKGFKVDSKNALLVGAGVGVAPLVFLADAFSKQNTQYKLLAGFRTFIDIKEINKDECIVVTEDNSSQRRGLITDYLEELILELKPDTIYACGPEPVLKKCVELAKKHNCKVEVALEQVFGCGVGVCMGCITEIIENGEVVNKRICKDGPVFDGRTLVW